MRVRRSRLFWGGFAALVLVGGLGTAGGFEIGRRWPLERLEEWLGLDVVREAPSWTQFAVTELPRYEALRIQRGTDLYLMGGFHGTELQASRRVEVLDLLTGSWRQLGDMPVALTHAFPAVVGDEAWIAGGFVGDDPGAATDQVWRYLFGSDEWIEAPSLPAPRGSGALLALGDSLYFFGGYYPDRITDSSDHWRLVIGDTIWRPTTPLPRPRGHFTAAVIAGELYAISGTVGHDPRPVDIRDVDIYDPSLDRWRTGPSAPLSTSHTEPSHVPYQGGLLLAGGRALELRRLVSDEIFFFDPSSERWIHEGRTPVGMLGGAAAILGDTLVVGLGAQEGSIARNPYLWKRPLRNAWRMAEPLPAPVGEVAGGVIDGTLYLVGEGSPYTYAFDISTGRWSGPEDFTARPAIGDHHAAEVVDGKLFLIGGFRHTSPGKVQIFDPTADEWRYGPAMPFPAGSSASALIAGRIYVAGGIVGDTTTHQAAVLDPETMIWSTLPPMPRARNHAASATDGERLFVFGGRGPGSGDRNVVANGYDDVQIFDPGSGSWSVSDGSPGAPEPLPQARGGMGKAVYLDGEFWVIGGETLDGEGATSLATYARVDIYDPTANRWRRGPDLLVPRHGIFPVVDEGRILVAGGGTQAGASQSDALEIIWPRRR